MEKHGFKGYMVSKKEWTGRMHGFEECMENAWLYKTHELKKKEWTGRMRGFEECMEVALFLRMQGLGKRMDWKAAWL